jgi:sulfur-oxidizing protein SoxY
VGLASAAVGLCLPRAFAASPAPRPARGGDLASPLEREHVPVLHLPRFTVNGAKVPIRVEMSHPMTPDHHVTAVHVVNDADPVPSKGSFHLTPANGVVYLAFQARMHHGISQVTVTAECNRHGRWSSTRTIEIPAEGGG